MRVYRLLKGLTQKKLWCALRNIHINRLYRFIERFLLNRKFTYMAYHVRMTHSSVYRIYSLLSFSAICVSCTVQYCSRLRKFLILKWRFVESVALEIKAGLCSMSLLPDLTPSQIFFKGVRSGQSLLPSPAIRSQTLTSFGILGL